MVTSCVRERIEASTVCFYSEDSVTQGNLKKIEYKRQFCFVFGNYYFFHVKLFYYYLKPHESRRLVVPQNQHEHGIRLSNAVVERLELSANWQLQIPTRSMLELLFHYSFACDFHVCRLDLTRQLVDDHFKVRGRSESARKAKILSIS